MTETQRPTQEEREHALEYAERAAFKTWANGDERRLARVTLALAAEKKALEERVRELRSGIVKYGDNSTTSHFGLKHWATVLLAADDAKAAGEPYPNGWLGTEQPDEVPVGNPLGAVFEPVPDEELLRDGWNLSAKDQAKMLDDRASRRLAYVREKAPVILAGLAADPDWANIPLKRRRATAIEQAGLIFDETEQSE